MACRMLEKIGPTTKSTFSRSSRPLALVTAPSGLSSSSTTTTSTSLPAILPPRSLIPSCRPSRDCWPSKAVELPEHHGDELRLWLRLLTCTTLIEGEVRSRLRERFDVTLPRFDLMAQLDKVPEGMTLSDVSKRMMVSNGNVTGLVERLVESGHLDRRTSDADRRVQVIRLTKAGRAEFRKMAAEHELWIADVFGDLTPKDVRELMRLLAKTKASAQKSAKARAD